ncbi:MAG TPA: aldehyde ferredoxin oxidoreductase [Thermoprotei archaeon]|nr:aldehyde ferredoxin oxidoreductase [Thermoprotei archaeon]
MGKILRVDLTSGKIREQELDKDLALNFIGGRGFAIKILWDELPRGIDPLSPQNKLIIATGPVTGTLVPSSGKIVIASKSPLTGGYGDGNIGSLISAKLKMCGYDAIVIEGASPKPVYLYVTPGTVELRDAGHLWGKGAIDSDVALREDYGHDIGTLIIGPAGENLVKISTVISEFGRAGGRPGMGAVFGFKKLKAIVCDGWKDIPVADIEKLAELFREAVDFLKKSPAYEKWIHQGTMMTIEWSQEASVLPAFNFSEGVFDGYSKIGGETMDKEYKVLRRGCLFCPMPCGNVCIARRGKYAGSWGELDYENVAMMGSNIGVDSMDAVVKMNFMADQLGLDAISTGSVIGFAMNLYSEGIISEKDTGGLKLEYGNPDVALSLMEMVAYRKGFGDLLAEGVKRVAEKYGGRALEIAMHVKGLEISAYDCHAAPGMALAYGTSPIGAHHKDAWFIAWELKMGRDLISREKAERLIEMQRIRGGIFETFTVCRLPWIELGLELDYYVKAFNAVTGLDYTLEDHYKVADRIYHLIRAFWIREYGGWSKTYDYPPEKWFKDPLSKGPLAGRKLDKEKYDKLLMYYYETRGWDENGIPKKDTLKSYGLDYVIPELEKIGVKLK